MITELVPNPSSLENSFYVPRYRYVNRQRYVTRGRIVVDLD